MLPAALSPNQSSVQAALRAFLLNVLPGDPALTPAVFRGSIAGPVLTVSAIPGVTGGIQGVIALNSTVLGAAAGTVILSQTSGLSGGAGTYQVAVSQTISDVKVMATGVTVIAGQPNRVSEPNNPWFAVLTPMFAKRLGTNQDSSGDVKFTGSISGTTLTVSAVAIGVVAPGAQVFAPLVAAGTRIIQQLTGTPGGVGTFQVSTTQNVSSETMSAGVKTMMQSEEWTVQVDFHSPDYLAGDFAQVVSTTFRDEFGTSFFASLPAPLNGVSPLYADDPRQVPFVNAENQYEWRWSLDVHVQVDEAMAVQATYADSVSVMFAEVP